jgi:hypothetical protein
MKIPCMRHLIDIVFGCALAMTTTIALAADALPSWKVALRKNQ